MHMILFWVKLQRFTQRTQSKCVGLLGAVLALSTLLLSGCATSIPNPPTGQPTVSEAYQAALSDDDYALHNDMHHQGEEGNEGAIRLAKGEKGYHTEVPSLAGALQNPQLLKEQARDNQNFPMLPNPQVMVYLFPHVTDGLPIHGNWSTFSLYANNHYALPSEVNTGGNSDVE